MDTTRLPDPVATYLTENREELIDFTERLVGFDTQNPPGSTREATDWLESLLDSEIQSRGYYFVTPLPGRLRLLIHYQTLPSYER